MTTWIQDCLPGMEFEDPWPPSWFGSIGEPCCAGCEYPDVEEHTL
jgi:hypothetical protein